MLNATSRNYCFKWSTSQSKLHVINIFKLYVFFHIIFHFFSSHLFTFKNYACLPARLVTDKTTCREASDCGSNLSLCVKPVWDNSTKLIRIVFESEKPLLYVGSVKELIYSSKFYTVLKTVKPSERKNRGLREILFKLIN